jgi:endonuclease YncB( thermonuclease family)
MSFFLIKGTFHAQGYSPDGDSIRFQADDSANWKKLSGPAVALNARKHAQIRMEAIDALETHYKAFHQPPRLARAAGRFLLSGLGITDVVWDETKTTVIKARDGTEGFILARSTESNRRPVAFVFSGEAEEKDGSEITLEEAGVMQSLNYKLLARGMAYPMYYNGLFSDLRLVFTEAAVRARAEGRGFWPYDKTIKGFSISDLKSITEDVVVLPKLFRRIIGYMGEGGRIDGFADHLLKDCEPLVRIQQAHFTRLDAVVEVRDERVRMTEKPENLIFIDKVQCKKS